jgi:TonB family protein
MVFGREASYHGVGRFKAPNMSNIVARSIFHTAVVERSWKTQVTSIAIHVLVIGAAFLITVPVVEQFKQPSSEHVTLVAPYIPHPHLMIEPPRIRHMAKLPAPVIPPPVTVAKIIPPPVIPKAPEVPVVKPQPLPEPKIEAAVKPAPPAPKPEIQTAKAAPAPKPVILGGFGDVHGVQNSETPKPSPMLVAHVGAFDSPVGPGQSGGGGHLDAGAVKQSGFGNAGVANGTAGGTGKMASVRAGAFGDSSAAATHGAAGTVRSSGFGDAVASAPQRKAVASAVAAFTPVEILFKPRPSYSPEARELHLEGQVSMEVVFQASGAVKVVRIIKGLGHGLDEAAQQAALQVRFKPATRAGTPVDTNATISITFEIS